MGHPREADRPDAQSDVCRAPELGFAILVGLGRGAENEGHNRLDNERDQASQNAVYDGIEKQCHVGSSVLSSRRDGGVEPVAHLGALHHSDGRPPRYKIPDKAGIFLRKMRQSPTLALRLPSAVQP